MVSEAPHPTGASDARSDRILMAEHQVMSQVDEHHSHQRDFVSHMRSKAWFKQWTKRACRNNAGAKARRPRSATCVSSQPRCAHRLSGKNPSLIRTKREAGGGDVARAPPCLAPAIARLDAEPLPGSLPTPFRRPGQSHPSPHPPTPRGACHRSCAEPGGRHGRRPAGP